MDTGETFHLASRFYGERAILRPEAIDDGPPILRAATTPQGCAAAFLAGARERIGVLYRLRGDAGPVDAASPEIAGDPPGSLWLLEPQAFRFSRVLRIARDSGGRVVICEVEFDPLRHVVCRQTGLPKHACWCCEPSVAAA